MKGRKLPVLPILAMLAIIAAGYGIYKNVEFIDFEYFSQPSEEVRANPYLAAARLLKETEGFEFERAANRNTFSNLSSDELGVLWLTDVSELEDQREAENILQWIKNGGVLLTSPAGNNLFDESTIPGWFMNQLGIESLLADDERQAERTPSSDTPHPVVLPDDNLEHNLQLIFSDYLEYFYLSAEDDEQSRTIFDSPFLIHRALGEGHFAVYADEDLFENKHIDKFHQAYVLLWLTHPAKHKTLSIIHRIADKPGLFTVIWNKFTIAVLILSVALVVCEKHPSKNSHLIDVNPAIAPTCLKMIAKPL